MSFLGESKRPPTMIDYSDLIVNVRDSSFRLSSHIFRLMSTKWSEILDEAYKCRPKIVPQVVDLHDADPREVPTCRSLDRPLFTEARYR